MRPLALLLIVCACGSEAAGLGRTMPVVRARFEPAAGVLPRPNDLDAAPAPDATAAERELDAWIATLDGFPIGMPIVIPFTGAVDPGSAPGNVVVHGAAHTVESEGTLLRLHPEPGAYGYAVRGYEQGLRGALGEWVLPDRDFVPLREAGGMSPDIVVAASYSTSARGYVRFDRRRRELPLPSDAWRDGAGRVQLPPIGDAWLDPLRARLAEYDGFSTTARLVLEATEPAGGELRLFRLDDANEVELIEQSALRARPRSPLAAGTRYVLTATLDVEPSLESALLRSSAPLALDARSQLAILSDATASELELDRAAMAPLLAGLPPVTLAVPFTTMTIPERVRALRQQLYDEDVATTLAGVSEASPSDRGMGLYLPSVDSIVTGTFTSRELGSGAPLSIEFVLTRPESPGPVVLFGHGLMTSRELVYLVAEDFAAAGYAMFAFDFPLHGERTECRLDLECELGSECRDGACTGDGFARVQDPLRDLFGLDLAFVPDVSFPVSSGLYYVDPGNLFASRDHFLQTYVDLMQAVRVLRAGGYDEILYAGMSLGGISGTVLGAVEPHIGSLALNVAGGSLIDLMTDATLFGFALEGTPELVDLARWTFDPVDPLNYARHLMREPLAGVPPKRVLLQMARGDLVIPNDTTRRLAREIGAEVSEYTAVMNHGMLFNPLPFSSGADARHEIIEFFDAR